MADTEEMDRRVALLELTTDLVSSVTSDGALTYLNAGGRVLLGWDSDEDVTTKRISDIHPEWASELVLREGLPSAMRDGVWRGETAILTRDDEEIPVSQVIVAHLDSGGQLVHLSTIMRDISTHKCVEEELRKSTQMFQLVMDYIPQFVFWKDRHLVYQGCNRNFAAAAGVASVEGIVGKTDFDLAWKTEEAEFFREVDREVMDADEPRTHIIEPQLQADGTEAWLDTSKIPLHGEVGEVVGILGMFEDISARRRAEGQLRHNQKMESIGQLAGGIAHDFNNMLAAISGSAELLAMELESNPEAAKLAEVILGASDKAAGLTQKLLDFSRKGTLSREPVDIHGIVETAAALLGRTVDRRISICTQLMAVHHVVLGDPSQLQNLLLNLGLNARDAMPEGGELFIGTTDLELEADDPRCAEFELTPGAHVVLEVRDTGIGMAPGVAARVFEPFFTTKEVGAGTGIGLSAVYNAVVAHHGAIDLHTRQHGGTSFHVYLPTGPAAMVPVQAEVPEHPRATGHILLVDDEEMVRSVTGAMLSSLGYEVSLAEDGEQAIELYAREHASIDLVLLDMVMPKLSGRETHQALREISPEVAVLFSSGFTRERTAVTGEGVRGFIKKPYRLDELARQVAEVMAGKGWA